MHISKIDEYLSSISYVSPWISGDHYSFNDTFSDKAFVVLKKGEYLFQQSDCCNLVYIVRTGRLKTCYCDSMGREKCVLIVESGGMLGELSAIDNRRNFVSAVALSDTEVYEMSSQSFMDWIRRDNDAQMMLAHNLCTRVRVLSSQLEYSIKGASARVAIILLSMCVRYGTELDGVIQMPVVLTHEEIANITNLNRVTVSKLIGTFTSRNILYRKNGYIYITHPDELLLYIK